MLMGPLSVLMDHWKIDPPEVMFVPVKLLDWLGRLAMCQDKGVSGRSLDNPIPMTSTLSRQKHMLGP